METTDEQLQMLLKERNELQAKQIEKDVKSDKRSMERLRQSVIWMRAVNKRARPARQCPPGNRCRCLVMWFGTKAVCVKGQCEVRP